MTKKVKKMAKKMAKKMRADLLLIYQRNGHQKIDKKRIKIDKKTEKNAQIYDEKKVAFSRAKKNPFSGMFEQIFDSKSKGILW